ncbi:hypothetical protein F3Y22_tig00110718pilonHSYRG00104 [Hibiscus syriacus]|uniref:DUF4283 domain-containing protein n=1 Tax=Hibiscus syriacus TaxID=106335 RepID=A0A6A2ZVT3_HIBSY|nr:hypothetical protein F3Y22_tig00110718pilonHSYRG00104 [Hibiscus syriacus]
MPSENPTPPLRDCCNPPLTVFVSLVPPPIGGNLAGNLHGIEVLSSSSLERSGSPFPDEDQHVSKKVRNKKMNGDRMDEDQNGMEMQSNADSAREGAMDEVVILDSECIVDNNGSYPVIQFADQVHNRIEYSMRRSVIVRLLGRAIGYKTLVNRIGLLWQLQGQYQVIDLENDYFLVKFEKKHPSQVIVWVRTGLPYRYYSKTIFHRIAMVIGHVVKIDYSTNSGGEAILLIWRLYGHSNDICGSVEANTSKGGVASGSSLELNKEVDGGESGFGPWMITKTRRRRTKKNPDPNMKTSGEDARGSRFAILGGKINDIEKDCTIIPEVAVVETINKSSTANNSRIDTRVKGKSHRSMEQTKEIRTLQQVEKESHVQINVIAMKDGVTPQVTEHRNVRAAGNHLAITILEDRRLHIASKSIRNKGNKRDWLRNVKFSTHLDRSMLHGESSSFLCENGGEEENAPAVGLLETVTEEVILPDVYASPQVEKRKLVWKHLINLDPGEYEAWTLGGDFNSILQLDKKEGGSCRGSGVSNLIVEFVFELGLFEVDFRGPKFTWRRCNLFKLLDRYLMNRFWADVFPVTMVLHLDRVSSDHCPLLLKAQSTTRVQGNRPFRFIAALQDHPQFKNFLLETWNNELDVLTNINSFQIKAIDWNLKDMLKKELEEVLQQEESLWLQKSRNQWILNGDKNTKYFHSCTMLRRRHNYVEALKATDGSWISDQEVLCLMAVNYYKDLFTSSKVDGNVYPIKGYFPKPLSQICGSYETIIYGRNM